MNRYQEMLEFNQIKSQLADYAYCDAARERLLALSPSPNEAACRRGMSDTTAARHLLDTFGAPPLPFMTGLEQILKLCAAGDMLLPEQLWAIARFADACRKVRRYLEKAEEVDGRISSYGGSIQTLEDLQRELERCIEGEHLADHASPTLHKLRRQIELSNSKMKEKCTAALTRYKQYCSDQFVAQRSGRYVLPVKRQYRSQVSGTVVELSNNGNTCFIEPSSVSKLADELQLLLIEEDAEVRRMLYVLTGLVEAELHAIRLNIEAMEELDFIFAKAKLSAAQNAVEPVLNTERLVDLRQGRHPLLPIEQCVPLDFYVNHEISGVIITGPNTGGKTVALKTVGLLSVMAQCGLHVPAQQGTNLALHASYHCDIGDGQSIHQNLSTFSGHMTNVIEILAQAGPESLVLLDELGSGTDPAEGMGIAVAVLEELRRRGCCFLVTTHYVEVKDYARETAGVLEARMAFDRDTLSPLYRLEIGRSGESCALDIVKRLGLAEHLIAHAKAQAYGGQPPEPPKPSSAAYPTLEKLAAPKRQSAHAVSFSLGDSVILTSTGEHGLVFAPTDDKGMVGIQVKGMKSYVNHKRLELHISAIDLYPPDYDFAILFDSVELRKARHQLAKGHLGVVAEYETP